MKVDENGSFSLDAGQETWQVAKNMRRAWFELFSGHSILPIWIVKKIHRMHFDPRNPKMKSKTHSMPSRSRKMSPSTFIYNHLQLGAAVLPHSVYGGQYGPNFPWEGGRVQNGELRGALWHDNSLYVYSNNQYMCFS